MVLTCLFLKFFKIFLRLLRALKAHGTVSLLCAKPLRMVFKTLSPLRAEHLPSA